MLNGRRLEGANDYVLGCLKPGVHDDTKSWAGKRIAAQCCTSVGECRRRDDEGQCIAGDSKVLNGLIEEMTYAEAAEQCGIRGLEMCQQSCAGKGCSYNRHPVFSSIAC